MTPVSASSNSSQLPSHRPKAGEGGRSRRGSEARRAHPPAAAHSLPSPHSAQVASAAAAPPSRCHHHVHGLPERCRRPSRGGDAGMRRQPEDGQLLPDASVSAGASGSPPLPREQRRGLSRRRRSGLPCQGPRRRPLVGQAEEGAGQEEPAGRRRGAGPRGQAGPAERGQRPRARPHAGAEQSLLPPQDHLALGAAGHQALQAGHAAPGLQLHRAPPADPGQRQVRERLHPPRQPDLALYGCWQTGERAERNREHHSVVWPYSILTQDVQAWEQQPCLHAGVSACACKSMWAYWCAGLAVVRNEGADQIASP